MAELADALVSGTSGRKAIRVRIPSSALDSPIKIGSLVLKHHIFQYGFMNFSVIIPTYNRATIIGTAIKSVLEQEGDHDFEIIVADDGSTDETADIIEKSQDKRIKYFKQDNQGPSAARNLGISHATKDWIVYLDSDNSLFPNYFSTLSKYLEKNPSALYAMVRARKTNELYESGKLIKSFEDTENTLTSATIQDLIPLKKIYFDVNGFAHAKKLINDGIEWDKNIKRLEDWEFLMQIAERYPENFLYIPDPLVHYLRRFGTDGIISNSSYGDWADAYEYIYQKHKNDVVLKNQTWYPQRVEAYRKDQKDFEEGKIPHQSLRWFEGK